MKTLYKLIITVFVLITNLIFLTTHATAQKTVIRGTVKDEKSNEALPYVSVFFNGTNIGTQTNIDGNYSISTTGNHTQLKFNYIGYEIAVRNIKPHTVQKLDVSLKPQLQFLNEIVVYAGKKPKYRNRDNPAVALIKNVIEHKKKNRIESFNYVSYKQYEKMLFSMSNLSDKFKNKRIFKNYDFLFYEQDSTEIGGRNLLPIYLQEKLSEQYVQRSPEKNKTVILAQKQVNFDENYIDNDGMKGYFDRMYQDVDIYDNNITLMSNQFLSPIADAAPSFYKYFITDTLTDRGYKIVELSFTPRNQMDMLFEGKLYVTLDGNYAVQNAFLGVNKHINLNFVRALKIDLNFEKNNKSQYQLKKSKLVAEFGITKEKGFGFTGERTVTFEDYKINDPIPDSVFADRGMVVLADASSRSELYWQQNRLDTMPAAHLKIYRNIDTLQTIPSFKRTADLVTLLFAGYKSYGPFEVGPVNTFYSFNDVEGFRLRVGGRTTTQLSTRYYLETYAAYGFTDQKWKYFLSGTYSLNNKSIYKFPQNYLRASFQRDTKIPGQELQFVQEDNFLLSFKRGENNMLLYNDSYRLDYVKEFENHFSYSLGLKKWTQSPAGSLLYRKIGNEVIENIRKLSTSEIAVQLRYAPNEKFYQGKLYRVPLAGKSPVFTLNYSAGLKGVLGGEYDYHSFAGSIEKRFYLSQLGYTDTRLEGGYIAGKVPFPLLRIHRANQSYAYQINSYNLMNFLEFVSDQYASIYVDHNFNGFFLNKVPLLRQLKLREVISVKALYGDLRNENNPSINTDLYQFPQRETGIAGTYALGNSPYVEGTIGLGNIFKILRVDLVKRFNYLNNPDVTEWGIRARFKFDF